LHFNTEISNCNARFDKFGASLKTECATRQVLLAAEGMTRARELEELKVKLHQLAAANDEIATVRASLQRLDESSLVDKTNYTRLESLISELQSRLHTVEPRLDTTTLELNSVREEVSSGFANLHQKVKDVENALERCWQDKQQQLSDEAQRHYQEFSNRLEEEARLRILSFQEVSQKNVDDMEAMVWRCDKLKLELSEACKIGCNRVERTASECHTAFAATTGQQISYLTSLMQTSLERVQQDLHRKLEELRCDFHEERSHQSKMKEEERTVLRKLIEEHSSSLEIERETRLRQTTELRVDFVKALTKEREARIMDHSEQHSEVSRLVREWQIFKKSGGLSGSNFATRSINSKIDVQPTPSMRIEADSCSTLEETLSK